MTNIKLAFKYAFKDLLRQRVRTVIGILGIVISIGLLALVMFLSDSISVTPAFLVPVVFDCFSQGVGSQV